MDSREHIEQIAAEWVARRDSGHWSDADQVELDRWKQASTWHRVAFLRIEAAWKEANRVKALGAGFKRGVRPTAEELRASPYFSKILAPDASEHHEFVPPLDENSADTSAPSHAPASRSRWPTYVTAAAVVLIALPFAWNRGIFARSDYSTPVGGLESIPMADGSTVTLNTNSEIRVAVTKMKREVELERGEAFFDVAKDPKRPFAVRAGDKRVIAVGTQFSVRRDAQDIRVVVTEGRVRIEGAEGASAMPATELAAGSIARAGHSGVNVQERVLSEAEKILSWRSGYLAFHDTRLADAAAEFNRYNTRKIVVDDPAITGIQIGGNFRAASVEAFVRLLENDFPVHIEQREDRIVLTREGSEGSKGR